MNDNIILTERQQAILQLATEMSKLAEAMTRIMALVMDIAKEEE